MPASRRSYLDRLGTAAALVAVLGSCRTITAPERPAGAIELTPPAIYARWWAMTEACSGVTGDFNDISWFTVPGAASFDRDGTQVLGYWTNAGNQIVLAGNASLSGGNVRHEMLHALLRGGGHPRSQFLGRCAGAVDCGAGCIADAGPPPLADATISPVTATSLDVTLDVVPVKPSSALDGGFFTVTVSVRNTATRPVLAKLTATNERARSFQFDLRGPSGGLIGTELVLDPSTVTFAAGETKRQLFDFSIGNNLPARRLPPGTYTIMGAYGSHWTAAAPVVVGP
jgi:hypothetical protein